MYLCQAPFVYCDRRPLNHVMLCTCMGVHVGTDVRECGCNMSPQGARCRVSFSLNGPQAS